MRSLWWVRHGPTHAKTMTGWTDLPADLSDHAALARLRAHLPDVPAVSSDLIRAITTADALQRPRLPHDADLREIHFGAWEGMTFAGAEARDADLIRAFWERPGDVAAPSGESWNGLSARVTLAVDRLAESLTGDLIIVAHMGVILTQVQRARRIAAYAALAQPVEPLSVTRIGLDGADLVLLSVNHRP